MSDRVVVLGAGYAGASAIPPLERHLDDAEITWISEYDYHLVLHEVHRVIRDPSIREALTVPRRNIASGETDVVDGTVVNVNDKEQHVSLEDGRDYPYDYLLIALGSQTAYYGIPGLEEYAHTLKNLDDALGINEAIERSMQDATTGDPTRVVIGGAGLSGIQSAGEIIEYRDTHDAPIEVVLVEALEEIMPGRDAELQRQVRSMLETRDVEILTDDPITKAEASVVHFDERDPVEYDLLVWTGGITGRAALEGTSFEANHNRAVTNSTFQTSDEHIFAVGDAAMVNLDGSDVPPTAQAAWDAAKVAAKNVARATRGQELEQWSYTDKGTVMSIGEDAVAHEVMYVPVETFNSFPARLAKKAIAARWIASITSFSRAASAWPVL